MWPEWFDAFLVSPFGWLIIPALLLLAFGVCGILEEIDRRRDAERDAATDRHPSAGRSLR